MSEENIHLISESSLIEEKEKLKEQVKQQYKSIIKTIDRIGENENTENKKSCFNCFYSQLMDFKGKKIKTVLWCNKKSFQCNNNICCYYKKGAEKIIPERVQLKKQRPRKKKRGRNCTKTYN